MLRNFSKKFLKAIALNPQVITVDTNTASYDTQLVNALGFLMQVGAATLSGTDKMVVNMQHSDDNSSFSNCADADMYVASGAPVAKTYDGTAGTQNSIEYFEYRGEKRYVRLSLDLQGSLNSVAVSVAAVAGYPEMV